MSAGRSADGEAMAAGSMTPEERDEARRQVAMDLAIAAAEEQRAETLADDLATALRKAKEAMHRAATLRAMLDEEPVPPSA